MMRSSLRFLDFREKIIPIFQEMADLNKALQEPYKVRSYVSAIISMRRNSHLALESISDLSRFPGFGTKLRMKAEEIIRTGKLLELEEKAKPKILAIRRLTEVHGFGPRAAALLHEKENISSIEELFSRADKLPLTDQQRVGIKYHWDIRERIPMRESKIHEELLKNECKVILGSDYEIQICGSYRRGHPFNGDVDAILSRTQAASPLSCPVGSTTALNDFLTHLQSIGYVVDTLAKGPVKFMGVARLPQTGRTFRARRMDIRLIETKCVPTALLTFTGSKGFNVIMRKAAIEKGLLLNEYGLFKTGREIAAAAAAATSSLVSEGELNGASGVKPSLVESEQPSLNPAPPIEDIPKDLESLRIPVLCENDVFEALGIPYAKPEDRDP